MVATSTGATAATPCSRVCCRCGAVVGDVVAVVVAVVFVLYSTVIHCIKSLTILEPAEGYHGANLWEMCGKATFGVRCRIEGLRDLG